MGLPLTPGQRGPEIADLRARLAHWQSQGGHEHVLADSEVFDEATAEVVRAFQRDRNLPADAVVGPETWQALVETNHELGDRMLWHSMSMMRGDDVLDLQHRLNQLGFNAGAEDGIFGPDVRHAVEEFQANVGLDIDGIVGSATLEALQRLHRGHQAEGVSTRLREAETIKRMARRGLTGLQVMVDPTDTILQDMSDVAYQVAGRLAGHLGARGARPVLSRGLKRGSSPSSRARLANTLGVDLVVSVGLNTSDTPVAAGCAAYYYGSLRFVSDAGRALAEELLTQTVSAGLGPDCRAHPMTWTMLRETRMPAVVVEPAFATNEQDLQRLADEQIQMRLVRAWVEGIEAFLSRYAGS